MTGRRWVVGIAMVTLAGVLAGCAERPKFADPEEVRKADVVRIKAIEDNPNLTPAQRQWQINRIKGQTQGGRAGGQR